MNKVIDNYCLNEVLGVGQYGKVYKALNIKTNQLYAVKLVKKVKFDEVEKLEEFTMNEIQTLVKIDNANIIKFIEMLKTPNHYYFVYEFCNGGTLENLLKIKGHFMESEALVVFSQLVNAFQSLVKDHIMHRDLKPANILLHNDQVKLADFGFCRMLNGPKDMAKTLVGSPIYMAPEVLLGHEYDQRAEMWSLGCVLYEMLYGECPYEEKTIAKLILRIQSNAPVVFNTEVNRISERTEILLQKMLRIDVEKRMSFQELFADEHVKRFFPSKEFDFANVVRSPNELDSTMKPMRIKKDRAIKYLYHERNKLFFMYNVLSNILELNCSNISALAAFLLMKFIRNTARYLKKNLLDQINPSAFLQLKKLIENWGTLTNTFEYKSFVNLVNKELELIEKEYPAFLAEAERFKSFTIGSTDYIEVEVEKELEREEIEVRVLAKYMIQYVEEIKRTFFFSPLDQKNDEENMKYLRHINEVLDVLLIDEFFENFLDIYVKFENQKYFEMIKRYAKDHLLNIVTNKIVFTKSKLGV